MGSSRVLKPGIWNQVVPSEGSGTSPPLPPSLLAPGRCRQIFGIAWLLVAIFHCPSLLSHGFLVCMHMSMSLDVFLFYKVTIILHLGNILTKDDLSLVNYICKVLFSNTYSLGNWVDIKVRGHYSPQCRRLQDTNHLWRKETKDNSGVSTLIPVLQRQVDLYECEASLDYRVNSMTGGSTQRNPTHTPQKKRKKKRENSEHICSKHRCTKFHKYH